MFAPLTLALMLWAQIPLSTQAELPTGEKAELAADQLQYEPQRQVLVARGHALLRTDTMLLRADELTYDQLQERASAKGNVMFVSGLFAAVAEEVHVDLKSFEATLKGGLFMQKKGTTQEALMAAKGPDELRLMGETVALLTGTRIKRTGKNAFVVENLAFTPCQCQPGEASWRVEASSAQVELGERAILNWPVVYVRNIPIFALPWLYLPISSRRSGLLVPRPTVTSLNGFSIDQPLFLTLGESYDLTLTPGYYAGGRDAFSGVKGPRLLTEFRYAPSPGTAGRMTLGLLYDLKALRDPRFRGSFFRDAEGNIVDQARGLRGESSIQHTQDLGHGFHDRVDFAVVSDGDYTRDLTADLIGREAEYLRSTASLYHRGQDHYVGMDVVLRQDLREGYPFFQTLRVPAAADAAQPLIRGPETIQRLPGLTLSLPERPLWKGLYGSLRVEFSRQAPLRSSFGDEGEDGFHRPYLDNDVGLLVGEAPRPLDLLQSDGVFNGRDREARDRLDFFPRLSTSFGVGPWLRVTPSLALRQDLYIGERTGRVGQRGYPLASLILDAELSRRFGEGQKRLRHIIAPSVQVRYVPLGWGAVPAPGAASPDSASQLYDEVDRALTAPLRGSSLQLLQTVAQVSQRLQYQPAQGPSREVLRLDLGQGFDFSPYAPALCGTGPVVGRSVLRDTYARFSVTEGYLQAQSLVRFDPYSRRLTQLSTGLSLDNRRGMGLFANYDWLATTGSDALRRGVDTLVGPEVPTRELAASQVAQQVFAGARTRLPFGFRARYEAILEPLVDGAPMTQQLFGLSYGPACDCWRIEATAIQRRIEVQPTATQASDRYDLSFPDFGVSLNVSGLGSFGS